MFSYALLTVAAATCVPTCWHLGGAALNTFGLPHRILSVIISAGRRESQKIVDLSNELSSKLLLLRAASENDFERITAYDFCRRGTECQPNT